MINQGSSEKLVALEAGLETPKVPKGLLFDKRVEKRPDKCTKYFIILLGTALLVVVSYEIFNVFVADSLMSRLEAEQLSESDGLTLVSAPDNAKIEGMLEELKNLKNSVKEMQEKIDQRASKIESTGEPTIEETAKDSLESIPRERFEDIRETVVDGSDSIIPKDFVEPTLFVEDQNADQDLTNSDVLIPAILVSQPVDENEGDWAWSIRVNLRLKPDVVDNENPESAATNKSSEKSPSEREWFWHDPNSSEDEAQLPTKLNSVEVSTGEPAAEKIIDEYEDSAIDADYYDDAYDSYDDNSEDEEQSVRSTTESTESLVSSNSGFDESKFGAIYELGSLPDPLSQFSSFGLPPIYERRDELSATEKSAEDSSSPDEEPFSWLYIWRFGESGVSPNRESRPSEDEGSSSNSDDWSYISKRSVDAAPELDITNPGENDVGDVIESEKEILREKLNNFYAKMEAVAAHIDKLHEKYTRMNKLDDDYVSKEFPAE